MTKNLCTWKTWKDIEEKIIHLTDLRRKFMTENLCTWKTWKDIEEKMIHLADLMKKRNQSELYISDTLSLLCIRPMNHLYTFNLCERGWTDVLIKKIFPIYQKKVTSHAKRCKYKDSRRKLFHGSSRHTKICGYICQMHIIYKKIVFI